MGRDEQVLGTGGRGSGRGRPWQRSIATSLGVVTTAGLVFVLVLVQVLRTGPLLRFDHVVQDAVAAHREPSVVGIAHTISWITAYPVEVIAGLLLAVLVAVRTRTRTPLLVGVVGMVALLVVPLIKELVGRHRPYIGAQPAVEDLANSLVGDAAFPSGHAATSTVFVGLVYLLVASHLARPVRRVFAVVLVAYAVAVGASRIYLGVHWFTDVLAGWALGLFVVAGLAVLANFRGPRPDEQR